jgi:processive 1,2-diacylglycerol beta-glucosyltransferase
LSPKILILHASVGAGHTRAAQAVAEALKLEAPDATVVTVDALNLARPLFKRAYGDGYLKLIEKAPSLFGLLFEMTDKTPKAGSFADGLRRAVQRWGANQLAELVETGGWDMIVHTHFLGPELIAALRRRGRVACPQMTVVTDYDAHRIWVHEPTERYCVASPLAAASLRAHGVHPAAIETTGIPVMPAFSTPVDEAAVRRAFGLSGAYPVVVLSSGGQGTGPIEETYRALLASSIPAEIVVVCGRNETARKRLAAIRPPGRHRVRVLGFTDRMRDLMAVADVLVTKPGGLTVSEALACGLPMALVSPIPGQEVRNSDYLLENGAAVKANSPAALTGKIEELLSSPARLAEMRRKAKALGHPRAAFAVARRALELARGRAQAAALVEEALAAAEVPFLISHWAVPGLRA